MNESNTSSDLSIYLNICKTLLEAVNGAISRRMYSPPTHLLKHPKIKRA